MYSLSNAVLQEYVQRIEDEARMIRAFDNEAYLKQREGMILGIGPDAGLFLNQLIKASRPKIIVEVGTAFGYSTLWLTDAAKLVGATVYSYEIAPQKQEYARTMMDKAGLGDRVHFICGDATTTLRDLDKQIDFVLIDLWKDMYIPAFDAVLPKLRPGAIVMADNMLYPDYQVESAQHYQAHVRATPGVETVTVPIGSGLEFSIVGNVE